MMHRKLTKIVVGALFLIVVLGSSFTIVFADQDIGAMLTGWFDRKTEESIGEIEEVVWNEQENQTNRLKEELRLAIDAAEQQLDEFVEAEKKQRVEELERYSDELVNEMDIDNSALESEIQAELDRILNEAKDEMELLLENEYEEHGGEE
ncbi:hypothetical protein ACFSTA_07585 [Ornithinibacillus salinisoli]|uniref:Uncharacterized protein n=1 Tax=Ornithinibacillus salinisoli TaxID=1848459 RepID=A0ABW4VYQ8_9BACI